jgi:hypothetical protein
MTFIKITYFLFLCTSLAHLKYAKGTFIFPTASPTSSPTIVPMVTSEPTNLQEPWSTSAIAPCSDTCSVWLTLEDYNTGLAVYEDIDCDNNYNKSPIVPSGCHAYDKTICRFCLIDRELWEISRDNNDGVYNYIDCPCCVTKYYFGDCKNTTHVWIP